MAYRKIKIGDEEWTFVVGLTACNIKDPNGKGYSPSINEVKPDASQADIDARRVAVGPGDIANWIKAHKQKG